MNNGYELIELIIIRTALENRLSIATDLGAANVAARLKKVLEKTENLINSQ